MRNVTINWPWRRFARALDRLTAPHLSIEEPEHRRKAQLLATLMLAMLPVSIFSNILTRFIFPPDVLIGAQGFAVTLFGAFVTLLIYILSRTAYYVVGATLAVTISSLAIFVTVFISQIYEINFLVYLIIPVVLSNIFISVHFTALLLTL